MPAVLNLPSQASGDESHNAHHGGANTRSMGTALPKNGHCSPKRRRHQWLSSRFLFTPTSLIRGPAGRPAASADPRSPAFPMKSLGCGAMAFICSQIAALYTRPAGHSARTTSRPEFLTLPQCWCRQMNLNEFLLKSGGMPGTGLDGADFGRLGVRTPIHKVIHTLAP